MKSGPREPASRTDRNQSYFFSGVLTAVGAVGLALMSGFLSTVFFSSLAGLAVGLAVTDGLDVAAGEAITTGVDVGVVTAGLVFVVVDGWHAVPIAVKAAKTVSRIDLLIVFP
jgi:hypothetical protein